MPRPLLTGLPVVLPAVLAVVLPVVFAVGCGAAATPGPPVDPEAVLRQAVERVMALESGTFTLEHQKGTTELLPGLLMTRVYGVADIPDRFSFTVEAQLSGIYVEIKMVVIEDRAYMTNPITGSWQQVPMEVVPFSFTNLGQTLADIIEAVESPTYAGSEELMDYTAYRITGRVKSEDLLSLVPGAGQGFDVGLELWVDRAEGLLLQVLITGRVVPTDDPDTVRTLTLDDIDIPVEINPPE